MREDKKQRLRRLKQVLISVSVAVAIIAAFIFATQGRDIPVLDPKGLIANQQRDLLLFTFGLGMLVIIPVFILLFGVAWKYREGNKKAKYRPEFDGHRGLEALWWGIPCVIILVLAVVTAISTYALDPYKPIESEVKPVKVQVVSLNWKWLFMYPEQGLATVNYMNIPKDTPIELTLTSDAAMNSFWVPALAGQIYTMNGMSTKLHIMADSVGSYNGSSSNLSGEGFAGMRFKVNSMNETDFAKWAKTQYSLNTIPRMTLESYKKLVVESKNNPEATYMLMEDNLYNEIIMKYMH